VPPGPGPGPAGGGGSASRREHTPAALKNLLMRIPSL